MSQLGDLLQESIRSGRETKTILALLREQTDMDGVDGIRRTRRRPTLRERLGSKSMGCCGGATWGFRPTTINASESEDEEQEQVQQYPQQQEQQRHQTPNQSPLINALQVPSENSQDPDCNDGPLINGGMNLAAALAAERHFRAVEGINVVGHTNNVNSNVDPTGTGTGTAPGTPLRVSLMRLLAETDGCDGEEKAGGGDMGNDSMCCVCMGRKKGAAFIPCGHTFCRVCSREMWLNRGSCPLCNRSILEILDIF